MLQTYNNTHGSGNVFGFDFVDHDGNEIHISTFGELVDSFYDIFQTYKVYLVSNGIVKDPNTSCDHLNSQWKIFLFVASIIKPFFEDVPTIPLHRFHFKTISETKNMAINSLVDIIGVVSLTSPTSTI